MVGQRPLKPSIMVRVHVPQYVIERSEIRYCEGASIGIPQFVNEQSEFSVIMRVH